MSEKDNLHLLPNANTGSAEVFEREADVLLDIQPVMAKIRYANYKEHLKAGFTEDQALQLCTNIFIK